MNFRQLKLVGALVFGLFLLITVVNVAGELFVTNNAGYYQVKQAAITGQLTVRDLPGVYTRLFGTITTYHVSDMHYFSKSNLDGGAGNEADPVSVQFTDGG